MALGKSPFAVQLNINKINTHTYIYMKHKCYALYHDKSSSKVDLFIDMISLLLCTGTKVMTKYPYR
jgi:hypothetical protein